MAVLGTQVPIDVRRNAELMVRFFLYLREAVERREPEVTMLDVWHRVQGSNALNDLLTGSRRLRNWVYARESSGSVLEEFMMRRSAGRLRLGHIYEDTRLVLREMARDEGDARIAASLDNLSFVPESLFYMFIGRPEEILLQPPVPISPANWKRVQASGNRNAARPAT